MFEWDGPKDKHKRKAKNNTDSMQSCVATKKIDKLHRDNLIRRAYL